MIDLAYVASGFGVGLLVGLTGVGGGSLMTPLLVLLFGMEPRAAVGTDLLYASLTKAAGSAVHGWGGTVDWRITGRLAVGSLPAAALTIAGLYVLGPTSKHLSSVISMVLGAALILTAACVFARPALLRLMRRLAPAALTEHPAVATVVFGVLLGVLVSISSVGAGAIGMTALIFLYPEVPIVRLVGSDIAHAVPLTLVAGLGHLMLGSIDGTVLASLLLGSVPGIVIASRVAPRVPEFVLRPALAATLALVGIRMLG
ncbi:MAG TPA: sulfite exporter TauE/SafE family protein [Stellaceae bacterium]|nr:sulfite exporter TauE/SafE family protein [Stellaceae bacterium]